MSSDVLLKAKDLVKVYSGTQHPLAALRQALFGTPGKSVDKYPVLHGIDLEIRRGETVGIMGRNGAGKTTLLGILGNVIQPTSGTVERFSRIATLLGLSAGFNANFSGRENAYLFCTIQGISKSEADVRMTGIQGFAELGRHFDLPLRTYSSGMQARLAFSCAVHVDCDLIIIDETLAVGDANFRMKCYDRIRYMQESGQTFLLVSHQQNLVANFCTRAIVLEGGYKVFDGTPFEAVEAYKKIRSDAQRQSGIIEPAGATKKPNPKGAVQTSDDAELTDLRLVEFSREPGSRVLVTGNLLVHRNLEHVTLNMGIRNSQGIALCAWNGSLGTINAPSLLAGQSYSVEFSFHQHLLPGRYFMTFSVHELVGDVNLTVALYQNVLAFDVIGKVDDPHSGIVDLRMQTSIQLDN
jgi:ABC-type polysaccharide/polyol phosphate transport system ATPase subunit